MVVPVLDGSGFVVDTTESIDRLVPPCCTVIPLGLLEIFSPYKRYGLPVPLAYWLHGPGCHNDSDRLSPPPPSSLTRHFLLWLPAPSTLESRFVVVGQIVKERC